LSRRAEKDRAFAAKQAADELINFMQYDLSDTLGKLGRLDMMKAINGRIRKYHEDHPPEASDLDALRETAVSFTQQSDLQRAQGDLSGALKSYRDSLAIAEKLAKQDLGNAQWQLDLAYSARNVASVLLKRKKTREAKPLYETFRDIANKLGRADPGNYLVQTDRANSRANIAYCEDQKTPEGRVRARALLQGRGEDSRNAQEAHRLAADARKLAARLPGKA
jgi:tetratricopeptide (TPR) repeat protein